jgi:curved DNA-binding protein CbpA
MQDKIFDPDKIIGDYNLNFYEILDIKPEDILEGKTTAEKQRVAEVLNAAYRKAAFRTHPDQNPNNDAQAFRLVIRAHTVLSDPLLTKIWLSKGEYKPSLAGDGNCEIDWSNYGDYRKNTTADTVGNTLFLRIAAMREKLNCIPAFRPSDENFDNYSWDFVLKDTEILNNDRNFKLSLSMVSDENEVLRLTSGAQLVDSLPFKIYICVPRASLFFLRGEEEKFIYEDGSEDVFSGRLQASSYSDYNLLETCVLEDAQKYIDEQLIYDLEKIRDGTLIEEQKQKDLEAGQSEWVSTNKMKDMDVDMLKAILRMKTQVVEQAAPNADNFINNMKNRKKIRR